MKRMLLVAGMVALCALGVMLLDDVTAGEKPEGSRIAGYITSTTNVDSTDASVRDTADAIKYGMFTGVQDYGTITGWFLTEYVSFDTATSSTVIPDTTADTVIFRIITADADGSPRKIIYTDTDAVFHVTASVVNGDYKSFNISDSTLWDIVYLEPIFISADSFNTHARGAGAGTNWKVTYKLYGK
jgi:hypothetical protein